MPSLLGPSDIVGFAQVTNNSGERGSTLSPADDALAHQVALAFISPYQQIGSLISTIDNAAGCGTNATGQHVGIDLSLGSGEISGIVPVASTSVASCAWPTTTLSATVAFTSSAAKLPAAAERPGPAAAAAIPDVPSAAVNPANVTLRLSNIAAGGPSKGDRISCATASKPEPMCNSIRLVLFLAAPTYRSTFKLTSQTEPLAFK